MRLIDADKIIFREIDEVGGEYEPYLGCSKSQIDSLPSATPQLSVPEVTALAEWTTKLTEANKAAYSQGYADGMKAQEPRKGRWLAIHTKDNTHEMTCSRCGYVRVELINRSFTEEIALEHLKDRIDENKFCPNCGADMREVEE